MPKAARRTWVVPRWLKEAFVAFALIAIGVVGVSKAVQHFGGRANRAAGAMDPGKFQLVAISVDEGGWPAIDKFFAGNPPPYAVALDQTARISQVYGTTKFPESYLIDSSGTLRLKFIGPRNWTDPAVFTLLASYGAAKRD